MKTVWNWIQAVFTAIGGFLGWFLGGLDGFLYALIAFVDIDYVTGVIKNSRYASVLNRSYSEMAAHYDTAIVPARVEHPKDKPNVEGTVNHTATWICAALRN